MKEKDLVKMLLARKVLNEVLNVSESSPGNDIEVSNVNLVSNPSYDVSKVVIWVSIL